MAFPREVELEDFSSDQEQSETPEAPAPRRQHVPIVFKLGITLSLVFTLGIGFLGYISLQHQVDLMENQMNQFGQSIAHLFAESAREPLLANDQISLQTLTRKIGSTRSTLGAAIYTEQGINVERHGIAPDTQIVDLYRDATTLSDYEYSIIWQHRYKDGAQEDMISYLTPIRYKNLSTGHVLVTFSRRHIEEHFQASIQKLTLIVFLMLLFAIGLAIFMSRRITRPIKDLVDASIAIGAGNYHYRINDKRHDEIGMLMDSFNDMAHGLLQKSQVESALSRYVSSNVAKQILNNLEQVELGGTHVKGTVLFADIVGFTSISETLSPQEVSSLLNEYFSMITNASNLYKGTIDKFIGDCAMIVFGVPERDPQQHFHAIACAMLIQKTTQRLNEIRRTSGLQEVHFRIGINTGSMLAGNMGSHNRMQYTVVGDSVNLASRLSNIAGPDEVLIQEDLYNQLDVHTRVIAHRHGDIPIRGKSLGVTTYKVEDIAQDYQKKMARQVEQLIAEHKAV